jgi:transcriptional regulator with XRE-family HTH domain
MEEMVQRGEEAPRIDRPHDIRVIGANLRRLRVKTGEYGHQMTQRELAAKAGIGHNVVGALEKSRDPAEPLAPAPTITTLGALAQVFGVETAELLRWDPTTAGYLGGNAGRLRLLPGGSSGLVTGTR